MEQHSKWVKGEDNVVETDEFELHDVIATCYHLDFTCQTDGLENVNGIRLVAKDPRMTESVRLELETAVNKLIEHMHETDHLLHKLAEYTC